MKHLFKCTWGSVELDVDGTRWNYQYCGNCPQKVKNELLKLEKKHPRPDSAMAHFVIKRICGETLLYIK